MIFVKFDLAKINTLHFFDQFLCVGHDGIVVVC